MKRLFFILYVMFAAVLLACNSNSAAGKLSASGKNAGQDTANYTTIQWLDSIKDFGKAKFGSKVPVEYTFKNTGSKPLYLLNVQPTCGCTIADYTKEAVMPGEEGFVKAVYDSRHGTPGSVRKSIIVTSNTINDKNFVLAFTGEVVK